MKILFVCTGNTCRSPMAAVLMQRALDKRGRADIIVESAGLEAYEEPVSQNAVTVISELDEKMGEELSKHVSRRVKPEQLKKADYIAVMNKNHAMTVSFLGAAPTKVIILSAGKQEGIADPYAGSVETYRQTRDELIKAVETMADTILN